MSFVPAAENNRAVLYAAAPYVCSMTADARLVAGTLLPLSLSGETVEVEAVPGDDERGSAGKQVRWTDWSG